ncbi:MAG TPA: TldD/PmbA family protein [Candidatus Atribacteria bacterium]|nr:TldD/PmbA family protein [Candidatus Atribacteria bacterium]
MKDINSAKELTHKIKSLIQNTGFEIIASEVKSELTRFAESYIHQNVAETNLSLIVKIINDDRISTVEMNSMDHHTMAKNIEKAMEATKITPKLDYHYQLLKPQSYKIKSKYSKDTADFTPLNRAQWISQLIKEVNKKEYSAAGAFKTEESTLLVANSEGVFAFDRGTKVDFNCVITRDNSTAHIAFIDSDINHFNLNKNIDELLAAALKNDEQIEIDPGIYTVILSPEALAEILNYTGYTAFNGKTIMEGKSFVDHNQGKKIFPEMITVSDDPFDELTLPIPFDLVGYPREKTALIQNGVVKDGVYDHLTALKYNKKCTGNTLSPEQASFGALPFNLVMQEGSNSLEEIISSTKKGIYISRFHYVNIVNPMSVQLTGMTRDGTFLIEEGRMVKAIKNMRFNTSVIDMLKAVDMISQERQTKPGFVGPVVAPYLRTTHFTFSSKTSF